jgi:hypothetical protein
MNLYQASRCYFDKSQKALLGSLILSGILLLLTLYALKPSGEVEDAIVISIIACTQLLQMWLKYRALYWLGKADVPRRMDQLLNGLGMTPSPEKCASIEEDLGKCDEPVNRCYWRSQQPPGPRRMIEMILESSFYTRSLAGKCQRLFFLVGSICLGLAALTLIISYRVGASKKPNDLIQHVVLTVLIFFLTGDFWNIGLLYGDLSQAADNSHKQSYVLLRSGDFTHEIALEITLDYNTAVVQAPPLLSFNYLRSRDATDEAFVRNYGGLLGLTADVGHRRK